MGGEGFVERVVCGRGGGRGRGCGGGGREWGGGGGGGGGGYVVEVAVDGCERGGGVCGGMVEVWRWGSWRGVWGWDSWRGMGTDVMGEGEGVGCLVVGVEVEGGMGKGDSVDGMWAMVLLVVCGVVRWCV